MANDGTGLLNIVLAGLGVGQVYELPIRDYISRGLVVPVLQDWDTATAFVSLMYPPAPRLNRRVRVFADWLVKRFSYVAADTARRANSNGSENAPTSPRRPSVGNRM